MPLITLKHQERARARAAAQMVTANPTAASKTAFSQNSSRDVIEAALALDLQLLSERSDVKEKIALKRQLLPKYLQQVHAYCDAGERYPNEVLVYCVIWLLDVEDIEHALQLAAIAIEQQQLMPERFKRDLPTYVAETVHDWAERQYKANQSASPYFDQVVDAVHRESWPVSQIIVVGKVYKLAGLFAERANDVPAAIHWFERATEANPKAGVKTRLEKLQSKS